VHFRILKLIATSGFFTALECTKFVFGSGELTAVPQTLLAGFRGILLLRGTGRENLEGRGRERRGRKGFGGPPVTQIPGSAPDR